MALIWYCEELKGDNPELSKKAMCEKASNIFNVGIVLNTYFLNSHLFP
jgi:hypothetical protein